LAKPRVFGPHNALNEEIEALKCGVSMTELYFRKHFITMKHELQRLQIKKRVPAAAEPFMAGIGILTGRTVVSSRACQYTNFMSCY
jgi:hypothetical protein